MISLKKIQGGMCGEKKYIRKYRPGNLSDFFLSFLAAEGDRE